MKHALGAAARWLVEYRHCWERKEADWFLRLAEFDRSEAWAADGQKSCVTWMMWRLKMARSTAYEKLQIGYELERRPVLLEAFRAGLVSYSALRLIAALQNTTQDVDEAFVDLAASDGTTIADVEHMADLYRLHQDQDLPPNESELRRQVSSPRNVGEGLSRITITLSDLEMKEFLLTLKSFDDLLFREQASAHKDDKDNQEDKDTDDSDDSDDDKDDSADTVANQSWRDNGTRKARRADAFMNLVASALSGEGRYAVGDERYMMHVVKVVDGIGATLIDGEPVADDDRHTIECDCSRVTHYVTEKGEPIHLGTKTRDWNTAQRRAVAVRDGGHCRFPGCNSRYVDLHHIQGWEHQGPTDVDNAMSCCR